MNKKQRFISWLALFIALFVMANIIYRYMVVSNKVNTPSTDISSVEEQAHSDTKDSMDQRSLKDQDSKDENERELPQVPNTQLLDEEGKSVDLHDFLGKPILINIWATWCPPCRNEMPLLEKAYDKYGQDIHFIMLNATDSRPSETTETVQVYLDETGLDLPVFYDQDQMNQITFGANVLPMTILIDKEGYLIKFIRGELTEDKLDELISLTQSN